MKVVKKNVYYCDYCKKRSLRSLKSHEEGCTANPDRQCRLCAEEGGNPPIKPIIEKYRNYFELEQAEDEYGLGAIKVRYLKEFALDDILKELDIQCPNCILAIIRVLGLNRYYFEKKFEFDYQGELKQWWGRKW